MSFLTGNVVTQCECIPLCKAKGTEQNHRIECTEVLSPLACRILDILLVTVTDETGNYAQVLSAVLSASTYTQTAITAKCTDSHIPAHCNKKVSPVTNYDANSL